jgi:hypothetical protein
MTAVHGAAGLLSSEAPKRQLSAAKPSLISAAPKPNLISKAPVSATSTLNKDTQCQYCLSESEFFSFFQGVYDG